MRFTLEPPLSADAVRHPLLKYLSDDRRWYTACGDLSAPAKHRAASILVDFHAFERNALGPFTGSQGPTPEEYGVDAREAAIAMARVASSLENLPEITVRELPDRDADAFLVQECRKFFYMLQSSPIPRSWQIEDLGQWPHAFGTWHALCERISLEARYAKLTDGAFHSCAPEHIHLYGVPRNPAPPKSRHEVLQDIRRQARALDLEVVDPARIPRPIRWLALLLGQVR